MYRQVKNMADMADKEIIKCTQCKKKFFEDGFKVSRLGVRNKTCIECAVRKKAYNEKNKDQIAVQQKAYKANNQCEHNVLKHSCYTCASGPMFCAHKLPRKSCITCTPKNFCKHNKRLQLKCRYCNPELFCNHHGGQQKVFCITCQEESKMNNPELHCAIDGHCGWVNKCDQCYCVEVNKERLRLKEAAEEAN
jgi:hypothetical protein